MRQALQALTDELRRLKNAGVKTVAVSDESVAALHRIVEARAKATPGAARSQPAELPKPAPAPQPAPKLYEPPPPKPRAAPAEATDPSIPAEPPAVVLPTGDKASRWAALREIVLQDATCCAHVRPGKKVVLGVGSLDARIMFVGEAPGAEEEVQGEPFVGPAGQLLTKMIQAMALKREEVYIGNIMNWRPEIGGPGAGPQVGNRPPTEQEMRYCLPYLRAQIEIVNPQLLVALGATAAQGLLGFGSFRALGDIRGQWHEFSGKPLMVTSGS